MHRLYSKVLAAKKPNAGVRESSHAPEVIPSDLLNSFLQGDRRSCARLITMIENDQELAAAFKEQLSERLGNGIRIGITGPPGVGKSTLTSAVALGLADSGHRVGIIAVDPTSPFTGGAFMGDRVRMDALIGDERIFMRSMASREGRGGLSPATPDVADVLEGFGMDRILIETVGVGQAELDVLECADLVILVLQPSTGDAIQTMKAGVIEAANIIVVNKSDLPGVDSVLQSLRFLFSLGGPRRGKPVPPIVATSALQNDGIEKLVKEIEKATQSLVQSGAHEELKKDRLEREIRAAIKEKLWQAYDERTDAASEICTKALELAKSGESPYPYIRDAIARVNIDVKKSKEGK